MPAGFVRSELHRNKFVSRANSGINALIPKVKLKNKASLLQKMLIFLLCKNKSDCTVYNPVRNQNTEHMLDFSPVVQAYWKCKAVASTKEGATTSIWLRLTQYNNVDIREETLNSKNFHHLLTSFFTQKGCATKSVLEEIIHRNHYAFIDQLWFTLKPKQKAFGAANFCTRSTTEASERNSCNHCIRWGYWDTHSVLNNLAWISKDVLKNWNAPWGSILLIYFHYRGTKKK